MQSADSRQADALVRPPDPAALALLDQKRAEMGIPRHIRDLDWDADQFIISAKHDIDLAKEILIRSGSYIAMAFTRLGDQDQLIAVMEHNGLLLEDAKFAVVCATKFGGLSLTGDAASRPRQISGRAAFPLMSEQQGFQFMTNPSAEDLREVAAKSKRQDRKIAELEIAVESEKSKRETAEKLAGDAKALIDSRFDSQGNPIWIPANENEANIVEFGDIIRAQTIAFCGRLRKLRCNAATPGGISPDLKSFIEGTVSFIEHKLAAEAVGVRASMGFGDPTSEALLQNAADDILDTTIAQASRSISNRVASQTPPTVPLTVPLTIVNGTTPPKVPPTAVGGVIVDLPNS